MYQPPNTVAKDFLNYYSKTMKKLTKNRNSTVICGLDHNLDFLEHTNHGVMNDFINSIIDHDLMPCITRPTRVTKSTSTLIDNILVDKRIYEQIYSGVAIHNLSDHFPCLPTWPNALPDTNKFKWVTKKDTSNEALAKVKHDLNIDWHSLLQGSNDVNEQFDKFHDFVSNKIDEHCQERQIKISNKKIIKEPWLTKGIIQSSRKQLRLYNITLKSKHGADRERYKQYRSVLQKLKRHCKRSYFSQQCERFKRDTLKLWQVTNQITGKRNDKSMIIDHITVEGVKKYSSTQISNEFANYYATLGQNLSNNLENSNNSIDHYLAKIKRNTKSIFFTPCTISEISKIIKKLKPKSSSGYDNISNKILKELESSLLVPLEIIINQSLSSGIFPASMKHADVIPLFKGGDNHLMSNYRPISLLLTLSKILEKVVYARVYTFLDSNNQIYKSQYGFRSKHSCEHAVSELLGDVLKGQGKGEHTISVFLDLSKAFDTLEHSTLLKKLEIYGIRGVPLNWFKDYLQNRSLRVKCAITGSDKSVYSDYKKITYGTPQGSCLGPLLFLVFCNDLYLNLMYSSCILFADDTTIYHSGKNLNLLICSLEHDLESINDWFKANKLTLNVNKTVCIHFNKTLKSGPIEIKIGNQTLPLVNHTKFLGI